MVEKVSLSIIAILLIIMVSISVKHDNEDKRQYEAAVKKKWASWVSYRDQNCKLTEKLIGVSMPNNRMEFKENANKYECNNGLAYTIAQSRENGKGGLEDIPTVN